MVGRTTRVTLVTLVLVTLVVTLVLLLPSNRLPADVQQPPITRYLLPQGRPVPPASACNSTVVTAYYRIPSKHSHEEYLAWMVNFLSLKDCMVIFCSPGLQDTLQALRPPAYPALIIPRPIQSFLMSRLLSEADWALQEKLDTERGRAPGHNNLLYRIWNEKTNMMKIVSDLNPFASFYFVWLDIGAVRHTRFNHQLLVQARPTEPGVLLLSVDRFTRAEVEQGGQRADFSKVNRVGGGAIGSGPDSLAAWHSAYYGMVERYRAAGRFLGKDQSVMASACLESGLCLLVQSDIEHWFLLQDWFRGDVTNTNYTRLQSTDLMPD